MLARGDLTPFIEMFDAHAAHLFDYCNGLLGDQEEAASATEATLIAAQSLLQDRERLRAWLFALARGECMKLSPDRADGSGADSSDAAEEPASHVRGDTRHRTGDLALMTGVYDADIEDLPLADISEVASGTLGNPLPPLRTLRQRQREALNLVYRHGIRQDDLPAVLGVPPEEAQGLLEAAEADVGQPPDATSGSAVIQAEETKTSGVDQISGLPLATLPPSIWRLTTTALFGTELPNADGSRTERRHSARSRRQPGPSAIGRNRLTIGAAALIPLAAGVAGFLYVAHPSAASNSPLRDRASATASADPASSSAAAAAPSHNTAKHEPKRHESAVVPSRPTPRTHASSSTPKPKHSHSPSPKHTSGSPAPTTSLGGPASPSPSPSPSSPSPSPSQSSSAS
jgi:hypothetical protein